MAVHGFVSKQPLMGSVCRVGTKCGSLHGTAPELACIVFMYYFSKPRKNSQHSIGFCSGMGLPFGEPFYSRRRSRDLLYTTLPFYVPSVSIIALLIRLITCCRGDYVTDTPAEQTPNFGACPSNPGECESRGWFRSPCRVCRSSAWHVGCGLRTGPGGTQVRFLTFFPNWVIAQSPACKMHIPPAHSCCCKKTRHGSPAAGHTLVSQPVLRSAASFLCPSAWQALICRWQIRFFLIV